MRIEKIISFANKSSKLRFLAMERSLRSTGCDLPVWVIPFDDQKFDLPENCVWWEIPEVTALLDKYGIDSMKRKFQCFLTQNYQYVDADVIFLRNPENVLEELEGFITSCGHWNNPEHTYVPSTLNYSAKKALPGKKVYLILANLHVTRPFMIWIHSRRRSNIRGPKRQSGHMIR